MIFMLPAATILDRAGRVMGHRQPTTPRAELRKLDVLVPRLRELAIIGIIASDLDEITAKYLARKLEVPFELWESLRRYNAGRLHGTDSARFQNRYKEMQAVWATKPDVPIKGGDSLTSFSKRIASVRERLAKAQHQILVVAESNVISALLNQNSAAERYRIYSADIPQTKVAAA